jgi:hypothetical protein
MRIVVATLVLCLGASVSQAWDGRFYDHTGSGPSYDAGRGVRFLSLAKDDADLSAFLFDTQAALSSAQAFRINNAGAERLIFLPARGSLWMGEVPTDFYSLDDKYWFLLVHDTTDATDDDLFFLLEANDSPSFNEYAGVTISVTNLKTAASQQLQWLMYVYDTDDSVDSNSYFQMGNGRARHSFYNDGTEVYRLYPAITDGGSAVAYILDSINTLSTSGAKLLSVRNAETEKFYIDYDGVVGVNALQFDLTYTPTHSEGQLHWDDDDKTLEIDTEVTGTHIQIGQETVIRCTNKTGVTISDGAAVYINGAQGNRPTIALADADAEGTSYVVGLVTADILNNATGYVTIQGMVRGYDTSGFTAGDALWVSSTAGALQNTPPAAPKHAAFVGHALNSAVDGAVMVRPNNGSEITELHDVDNSMAPTSEGDTLVWEPSTSTWTSTRDNTYTRHLQIDAHADAGTPANQPSTVSVATAACLEFANSASEYAYPTFEIPDDWDGETVIWDWQYRSVAEGGLITAGTVATGSATFTDGGAGTAQYLIVHTPFTLTYNHANQPLAAQDHVFMVLDRNNADTFAGKVCITAFEVIYESTGLPRL